MWAAWMVPVGVEGHLGLGVLVARLAGGQEVLATVLHPLHRRAHHGGGQHQAHLVALDHDLLPEAAAGVAHHHPDAVLGHAQQSGAEQADLVGRLGGRVDGELAGRRRSSRPPGRGPPSAPPRSACWEMVSLTTWAAAANDLVERRGGQAGDRADDVGAVALVDQRAPSSSASAVVDDGRERVVVDVDQLGRVLGQVAVVGHDQHHRVAHEAHLVVGQRAGGASRGSGARWRCATARGRPG